MSEPTTLSAASNRDRTATAIQGAAAREEAKPYSYRRMFMPTGPDGTRSFITPPHEQQVMSGDYTTGLEYEYTEEIILAVNIAIATGRPLLVEGDPGTGKTSLARSIARWQGWPYYEQSITSRTQARDLLWQFDTLLRLRDAQVAAQDNNARARLDNQRAYLQPGVLWWALDPQSAARRGAPGDGDVKWEAHNPVIELGPRPHVGWPVEEIAPRAVVLLDEIDKADPDVPNDLLLPLGSMTFTINETEPATIVTCVPDARPPLVIITNNRERELPPAFLRRCILLSLQKPDTNKLVQIAVRHFGEADRSLYEQIARQAIEVGEQTVGRRQPSTAEFLDAIESCRQLRARPDTTALWERVKQATLLKPRESEPL